MISSRENISDELLDHQPPMSQSERAPGSGVSFVTINAITNNEKKRVQVETFDKLATAFGVEPGDLIGREGRKRRRRVWPLWSPTK